MSPLYVKQMIAYYKCKNCSKASLTDYTLCQTHLVKAKLGWRAWQDKRRAQGVCCYCHRKSFRGWLRCKTHREINRQRCLAWATVHPEHSKEAWAKRKQLMDLGYCPSCKEHRKLDTPYKRCEPCRERNSLRRGTRNAKRTRR